MAVVEREEMKMMLRLTEIPWAHSLSHLNSSLYPTDQTHTMRPPRGRGGGGGFRGGRDGGRGFGGGRGRGGGGRFGGGGGRGFQDEGPPAEVVEVASFVHACEGDAVTKLTNEKIPYFNAPIYLENKTPNSELSCFSILSLLLFCFLTLCIRLGLPS